MVDFRPVVGSDDHPGVTPPHGPAPYRRRVPGQDEVDDLDDFEDVVDDAERVATEAWRELVSAEGYLLVVVLLFSALIAVPLIGDSKPGLFLSFAVVSTAVVLTVFRSTHRTRIRRVTTTLTAVTAAFTLAAVFGSERFGYDVRLTAIVVSSINGFLQLAAFPLVLARSFRHRRVTLNTVCATLSAYLLIGLIFATAYRLLHFVNPPFFAQTDHPTPGQFSYFSVVTLTTLGFGDLTPATDPGRAFVMVEAVIGQVFLVTTLARVVSLLGEERRR